MVVGSNSRLPCSNNCYGKGLRHANSHIPPSLYLKHTKHKNGNGEECVMLHVYPITEMKKVWEIIIQLLCTSLIIEKLHVLLRFAS